MTDRKRTHKSSGSVVLPNFVLYIGLVDAVFCSGVLIWALIGGNGTNLVALWTGIVFFLLGAVLIAAYSNCRIHYDGKGFSAGNLLGIHRRFSYSDITGMRGLHRDVTLWLGRKKVRVDSLAVGREEFLDYVRYVYRCEHDGLAIPQMGGADSARSDLFHGHVEAPGEFVFVYSLVIALCLGVTVWAFFSAFKPKMDASAEKTVSFVSASVDHRDLWLRDSDGIDYKLKSFERYAENLDFLYAQIGEKTRFVVRYDDISNRDEYYRFLLQLTGVDGTTVLSEESSLRQERDSSLVAAGVGLGMALLIGAVFLETIRVGRHPERYSRWFVRLFFKDGYIH